MNRHQFSKKTRYGIIGLYYLTIILIGALVGDLQAGLFFFITIFLPYLIIPIFYFKLILLKKKNRFILILGALVTIYLSFLSFSYFEEPLYRLAVEVFYQKQYDFDSKPIEGFVFPNQVN